jgi:hypothetical protein
VCSLRRDMQNRVGDAALRRLARPQGIQAVNNGQTARTLQGAILRGDRVSNGVMRVSEPVVVSAGSGVTQQERQQIPLRTPRQYVPRVVIGGNVRILVAQQLADKLIFWLAGDRPKPLKVLEFAGNLGAFGWIESLGTGENDWLVAYDQPSTRTVGIIYGDGRQPWTVQYPTDVPSGAILYRGGGYFSTDLVGLTRIRWPQLLQLGNHDVDDFHLAPRLPDPTEITQPPLTELLFPLSGSGDNPFVSGTHKITSIDVENYPGPSSLATYTFDSSEDLKSVTLLGGSQGKTEAVTHGKMISSLKQYAARGGQFFTQTGTFNTDFVYNNLTEGSRVSGLQGYANQYRRVINLSSLYTTSEQITIEVAPGISFDRLLSQSQSITENYSFMVDGADWNITQRPGRLIERLWSANSSIPIPSRYFEDLGYVYEVRSQSLAYEDNLTWPATTISASEGNATLNVLQDSETKSEAIYFVFNGQSYPLQISSQNPRSWKLYGTSNSLINIACPDLNNFYLNLATFEQSDRLESSIFKNLGDGWGFEFDKKLPSKIHPFIEDKTNAAVIDYAIRA